MNNSRLIFKNINDNENISNDLVYSLNSLSLDDCVQFECVNSGEQHQQEAKKVNSISNVNINIVKPPPVFNLPPPPDPLTLLGLNDLHMLGLYASSKARTHENFLLHLLNASNKLEQCVDLRLQMTTYGLKKNDSKTSTGFINNNSNNIKQSNNNNRLTNNHKTSPTKSLASTTLQSRADVFYNPTTSYSIQPPINSNNSNNHNNNIVHFVLLSFMSLFCLLLILVLIYFLVQRKKLQKNVLNQHNSSLASAHNRFDPIEHLYHQHHTLKKDTTSLERAQSNNGYNLNQIQQFLHKQQLQLNESNSNSRQQHYVSAQNCGLPISTSLLTFDWLSSVANKQQNQMNNNQSFYPSNEIDVSTKKKLVKKYSDTSRKSSSINQQTEMKLLQQPLLDPANIANSTLSTRATVTASSSSSSSSSVSSSMNKNESVNHYQKLYPKMMNQANENFLNYSIVPNNDVNSAYNNLLIQNLYSGTLLNNKTNGYNKVALICNANDPNVPPQLIKIMNLNPDVNCDCIQMINLDPNLNSHMLFETNHYENYRNLPNSNNINTNKRYSQIIETSNICHKNNVDTNNPEQFYELIDDNILSSNLTSNNYCEWTDNKNINSSDISNNINSKNKANLVRRNSSNLTSSFSSNTKTRKYPKTNPNYNQSNYVTIKNNASN